MDSMLSELAEALKRYVATEHGKRSAQHADIVRDLFRHAGEIADEIERLYAVEDVYDELASSSLDE